MTLSLLKLPTYQWSDNGSNLSEAEVIKGETKEDNSEHIMMQRV